MTKLPPIIFCGIVRNAGAGLVRSLETIDRIRLSAEKSFCILVTNDNTDDTAARLRQWKGTASGIELQVVDGFMEAFPDRMDRLPAARNFYLKSLQDASLSEFEFVCVLDLDGLNSSVMPDAFAAAMGLHVPWDGLFANQRGPYYDLYALRHASWCQGDCWEEVRKSVVSPFRKTRRRLAIRRLIHDRQYYIAPTTPPIRVESAFGGLAIYRKNALLNCWYGSRDKHGRQVCEHVILHQQMVARGANLFIAPPLMNDTPKEHVGPTSGQPFPLEYC